MESGAGISLDPVGTVIRLESAVSGDLQYRAADNHHGCICLAGEAHLETAGDPDGIVQPVFSVCQIYAVRYAGGDLLQLADPVLRTGHELSEKGEPRETDRHARDLGTADSDAALYAAVSGSGLLFLDLP